MAYSRWSSSHWYAFWDIASGPTRETQKFALWWSGQSVSSPEGFDNPCPSWDFLDAQELLTDGALEAAYPGVSEADAANARALIREWIADLDANPRYSKPPAPTEIP